MEEALVKTGLASEQVRDMLKALSALPDADPRALSVARTQFETDFLWAANAAQGESVLNG